MKPTDQIKNHSKRGFTKIMAFGTFDILHPGHIHFFQQAKKLAKNPFLIVSVARDVNVKKIKGRKPDLAEKSRLNVISHLPLVDKAVLGGKGDFLPHILKEKPNIIALGYDQAAYTRNLARKLLKKGLKVKITRLKPYRSRLYKSSILKQRIPQDG